jgi:glyoxylase I family protein
MIGRQALTNVDGIDALRSWETTLDASNVIRSPIVESPFGWHLNVRAPDNIAVELLAMKPEASAALYG